MMKRWRNLILIGTLLMEDELELPASLRHLTGYMNAWRGPNSPLTDDVTLVAVALRTDTFSDAFFRASADELTDMQYAEAL
jgi:hypothetical protein